MRRMVQWMGVVLLALSCSTALADVFETYENLNEGFLGTTFAENGVTYHGVNGVSGVFPDGSTFTPADTGDQLIIEKATYFYNDFPGYGSPNNAMSFGTSYVPGDNLTIGALSQVWMDLDQLGNAASLDIGYYENGPWGGISYVLDGLRNGQVVASDSFVLSDLGGRDNPNFSTMSISGAEFDQLHLYAQFGGQFSAPRGMIDNLAITGVPEPAALTLLAVAGLFLRRR